MKLKKMRTLVGGQKIKDLPDPIDITINTRAPKKWAFVDMETADVWVHESRLPKRKRYGAVFKRADVEAIRILKFIFNYRH